jgi:RimJ/RimL family protein N-acetyltransferase
MPALAQPVGRRVAKRSRRRQPRPREALRTLLFVERQAPPLPGSLIRATDIAALPLSRELIRRDGYLVVRSPSNQDHYWGNLIVFDDAPAPGDGPSWEARFEEEFADLPAVLHHTFAWDRTDGELGAAQAELLDRGYVLEQTVGLAADVGRLRAHPRENRDVAVRSLDHRGATEEDLFEQVIELQIADRLASFEEAGQRAYAQARMRDLRELFSARGGGWFVALDLAERRVLGSCGIVLVGDGLARYQAVDTLASHRRMGICSRLLVEAAQIVCERSGAHRFVIGADPDYHALGLYESLGFSPVERVAGAYLQPPEHRT